MLQKNVGIFITNTRFLLLPFITDGVFQFILNGLQDKELVTPSSTAFEYLCVECKDKLTERFPVILQVRMPTLKFGIFCRAIRNVLYSSARL